MLQTRESYMSETIRLLPGFTLWLEGIFFLSVASAFVHQEFAKIGKSLDPILNRIKLASTSNTNTSSVKGNLCE